MINAILQFDHKPLDQHENADIIHSNRPGPPSTG